MPTLAASQSLPFSFFSQTSTAKRNQIGNSTLMIILIASLSSIYFTSIIKHVRIPLKKSENINLNWKMCCADKLAKNMVSCKSCNYYTSAIDPICSTFFPCKSSISPFLYFFPFIFYAKNIFTFILLYTLHTLWVSCSSTSIFLSIYFLPFVLLRFPSHSIISSKSSTNSACETIIINNILLRIISSLFVYTLSNVRTLFSLSLL